MQFRLFIDLHVERLEGALMRKPSAILAALLMTAASWAQTSTTTPTTPAKKPATAAHTPVHHAVAPSGAPTAVFDTTAGTLRCTLFEKETPVTVKNFIDLATGAKDWKNPVSGATKHKTPLYDGTIFHRVIPNFMIQGGDPRGDGTGDPGYTFKDEFVSTLAFDKPGRLAMANSGPNTNGSQFFITEAPTPHLNGKHTIFGQCDDASVELVKKIARMATDPSNDKPFRPIKITHLSIVRGSTAASAKPAGTTAKKPAAATAPKKTPAAATTPN
jgi:cyclophilin family peptidyl-prolyl cis-trans isomerase